MSVINSFSYLWDTVFTKAKLEVFHQVFTVICEAGVPMALGIPEQLCLHRKIPGSSETGLESFCLPRAPPWPSVLHLRSLTLSVASWTLEGPDFLTSTPGLWAGRGCEMSESVSFLFRWQQCHPERRIELTNWTSCKASVNSKGRTRSLSTSTVSL